MCNVLLYEMGDGDVPSYSGRRPSRTLLAILGVLPIMIVGMGDILGAEVEKEFL
jgi:hypothetical protein